MTRPSKHKPRTSTKQAKRPDQLWLACFEQDEPGDDPRIAMFQVVLRAATAQEADQKCRVFLRRLRISTSLFDRPCTIYLQHFVKFAGEFKKPLLVNYSSWTRPDTWGEILCAIPEQNTEDAESYGPRSRKDEIAEPFLDFGGEAIMKTIRDAMPPTEPAQRTCLPEPELEEPPPPPPRKYRGRARYFER